MSSNGIYEPAFIYDTSFQHPGGGISKVNKRPHYSKMQERYFKSHFSAGKWLQHCANGSNVSNQITPSHRSVMDDSQNLVTSSSNFYNEIYLMGCHKSASDGVHRVSWGSRDKTPSTTLLHGPAAEIGNVVCVAGAEYNSMAGDSPLVCASPVGFDSGAPSMYSSSFLTSRVHHSMLRRCSRLNSALLSPPTPFSPGTPDPPRAL